MNSDGATRIFTVIDDAEENGFARLVEQGTGQDAHTELFILESGEAVRLRTGDEVIGRAHGRQVAEIQILNRAQPHYALRRSIEVLMTAIRASGIEIPVSADIVADREWRLHSRQTSGRHPYLRSLVFPHLTFLFQWGVAHPLDDGTVIERLIEAIHPFLPGFVATARIDRDGDLKSFRVCPSGPEIGLGDGDWEQPKGCYASLVEFVNKRLWAVGAPVRWMDVRQDWLLTSPATCRLLLEHGLVDPSA